MVCRPISALAYYLIGLAVCVGSGCSTSNPAANLWSRGLVGNFAPTQSKNVEGPKSVHAKLASSISGLSDDSRLVDAVEFVRLAEQAQRDSD
ncbi:hypothetical protein, partial [Novipirellula artificiosorum]|uniref:hypothetical protein n=1 Tax=Novipirellula artificiosorum TaxID=2528016 RepID=UPI0011B576F1